MSGDNRVIDEPKSKRKRVYKQTLDKVEDFLKKAGRPVYKSELVKQAGVDLNSAVLALEILNAKRNEEGAYYLC